MNEVVRVHLIGPPAGGKSLSGKYIQEHLGVEVTCIGTGVSITDHIKKNPNKTELATRVKNRELLPWYEMWPILCSHYRQSDGRHLWDVKGGVQIWDSVLRSSRQVRFAHQLGILQAHDVVLNLVTSDEVTIANLRHRNGRETRDDGSIESHANGLKIFRRNITGVIEMINTYGIKITNINGNQNHDAIRTAALSAVNSHRIWLRTNELRATGVRITPSPTPPTPALTPA